MKNGHEKIWMMILGIAGLLLVSRNPLFAQEISVAVIDSGATGYVDSGESFTSLPANQDPLHHGTEIAKLVRQGNPSAKIYMLQVCEKTDGTFKPSNDAIVQAIRWAVNHQIKIVNMSLVTKYDKQIEDVITDAATSHGILFIAAAGNKTIASHFAADSHGYVRKTAKVVKPSFPASNPYVISVGGLDENGRIASYSDKICDVYERGKILGQEGSSFACARVTSRVVQILSTHPTAGKTAVLSYLE